MCILGIRYSQISFLFPYHQWILDTQEFYAPTITVEICTSLWKNYGKCSTYQSDLTQREDGNKSYLMLSIQWSHIFTWCSGVIFNSPFFTAAIAFFANSSHLTYLSKTILSKFDKEFREILGNLKGNSRLTGPLTI